MRGSRVLYAAVFLCAAVVSCSASTRAESPNGTVIPGAASIVDGSGNVWTMPSLTSPGNIIYKNGNPTTGDGLHVLLIYYNGTVYAANAGNIWYQFTGSGWTQLADGVPNPSPSGTSIPSATAAIVDGSGNVWTMPSLTSPGNVIYKNGNPTTGDGLHVLLTYYNGTVYAANAGNIWYQFSGSVWTQVANGVPNPSPNGTAIPGVSSIVDASGNVWTMPSLTSPGNIIYKNGNPTTADGGHVLMLYYNGSIYAENTGNAWYQMTGTGWTPSTPPPTILPSYSDASANWMNAGLQSIGGIPNRTTICATVIPLGGGQNDFARIQTAIDACPAGQVVQLAAGAFTVKQADLPIQISSGITLRGGANCNGSASPYCQTSITVADGALAYTGGTCGLTAPGGPCPNGGPAVIEMSPVSPDYNYSWAQCGNEGTGLNCGAVVLTADAVQGQTTIQVASTSKFSVGQWVLIDEASGAGWVADPLNATTGFGSIWAAPDWLSPTAAPATGRVMWAKAKNTDWDFGANEFPYTAGSSGCWFSYCDRPTAELHKIASIGTGTLTFDDPLTVSFRQSGGHNARVYPGLYNNQSGVGTPIPLLQSAGLENLSILRAATGGVEMEFCAYCWMKNVEVGNWYGGGVGIIYSARSELNNVYVHHCWNSVNNGAEYPISLDNAATEILITNSITAFAGKGMVARAGGAGSVVSYSYIDDTMYDDFSGIGDYWVDMGINASHYSGPHHVLFEGNWGDNLDNDHTHGNSMYMTFFRNLGAGLRAPFTDPSNGKSVNDATGTGWTCGGGNCSPATPGPLRAAGPSAYNYWFAFLGNVLGVAGKTTAANGWSYEGDWNGNRIFMLGWNDGPGGQDPYMNGNKGSYVFRHGNFDYVTNGVQWDPNTPNHALPNSLYLTSAPAFFGGRTWPWVNPTGTPQLFTLPAQARFAAGTPLAQ